MTNAKNAQRGEIWLIRLDPAIGREIRKSRPCLIVSPDGINRHLGTVIVMPMTTGSHPARFRPDIAFHERRGLLLGDQIRSVSKECLSKRLGLAEPETRKRALRILREMFEE
ncbi:type II toxin-antitoxin system PemK/MazF family toxin [Novosphingopyxis sp.]|uniref:type II toxin-antitoxin system PemK/MazF family toxin n=1 Tax=Novosphingopyxis sp. TaxID=2709690 RepID=UPI003B596680